MVFFIFLVIIWSSIKYLPSFYLEHSKLKKEKEAFQIFYEYTYLNQFKNSQKITSDKQMQNIFKKDSFFMNDYKKLFEMYNIEMKKRDLKEQLKSLER